MTDVAPELLEAIEERFRERADALPPAAEVRDYAEAADYAGRVSRALTEACGEVLTDDALPDGRLYWNIADRVLRPMLGEQTTRIADACESAQTALNREAGIGMKAVRVTEDAERARGILDEAARAERFYGVSARVYSHIENLGLHTVDESARLNADAQWKAGLAPVIRRTGSAGCCDWCAALAGVYDYADCGKDAEVWQRHVSCGCLIEYFPGDGRRETVNNYRWDGDPEKAAARKAAAEALTRDDEPVRIEARRLAAARAAASLDRQGVRVFDNAGRRVYTGGHRNEAPLADGQIAEIDAMIKKQGYIGDVEYTNHSFTSFWGQRDTDAHLLVIGTDVYPSDNPKTANERLSCSASVAHEVTGHYRAWQRGTTQTNDVLEEAQASIRASRFGVDLSSTDRANLMRDALDRLEKANIKYKDVADVLDIWEA